jgi:hypothetical protein
MGAIGGTDAQRSIGALALGEACLAPTFCADYFLSGLYDGFSVPLALAISSSVG